MSRGFSTDGINTFVFASGNGCTGNCLGLTALVLQTGQRIVESDITFNANYNWQTNGLNHDTQGVATHELGHSLGIHHTELTTTPRPTMFDTYFGTGMRSLEFDDQEALRCTERPFLSFFEGNSGTQDYVCNLDPIKQQINFKNDGRCANDEARSMRLRNVQAGYRLNVYDDPGCKTSDDWTEIRVLQKTSLHYLISTFEQSSSNSTVQVIHHHNNGLDGKISCIKATICGDQICEGSESCSNCTTDCGACPYCGDGSCNGTEYCVTCATDCGACGCNFNGVCEWNETTESCSDCCGSEIFCEE